MMVLPAPGSSASRKRSGWRESISPIDGGDLVRQRLDERGVDGQQRIEEVGQADAVASETSRKSAPSPSKLQGRPADAISRRGSPSR